MNIRLEKVKSHQQLHTSQDPLCKYWAIGNHIVDHFAQHARRFLEPGYVERVEQIHQDILHDKNDLGNMYNLHLALQDVRARATANLEVGDKAVRHGQWSLLQARSSRTVSQSPYYFDDADLQFLRHASFSEECATLTYHWIKSLAWPETDAGHLGCITGATLVELSLSWTCFNRKYIPVLRKDHMGIMRSFFLPGGQSARDHGLSFTESGTMLQKMIENVCGLIPQRIWPADVGRRKVSALYRLGSNRWHQGLAKRPQMP